MHEIRPAYLHSNVPKYSKTPSHERDDKGRVKMPAYLLTAHKAR